MFAVHKIYANPKILGIISMDQDGAEHRLYSYLNFFRPAASLEQKPKANCYLLIANC